MKYMTLILFLPVFTSKLFSQANTDTKRSVVGNKKDSVFYDCPNGQAIKVVYYAESYIKLQIPGIIEKPVSLFSGVSASGARYVNDSLVFWEHQNEVRIELKNYTILSGCKLRVKE